MPASGTAESPPRVGGKTISINLPALHPGQLSVESGRKRFNCLVCGRRWGKSLMMRDRLIRTALKGKPTAWFAPTNKVLADSWREMKVALGPITIDKSENEHRIEIMGSGVVEMWSLESPDAGRSRRYATVVVDEAAMAPNLSAAWQENIRPTLTDFAGDAWFASTPKGTGNYFKVLFDRGPDPEWEHWASWQMPTSANPFLPPDEIEEARRDMTEAAFNQEYLAMFVNWEGSVFRNVQECATGREKLGPEPGHKYVMGIDWGRTRDYTVITVIDVTDRAVVALDRFNQVDYSLQRNRVKVLRDKWKPIEVIVEGNSIGIPNAEELEKDGVPVTVFQTQEGSKKEIIEHLALAFEQMSIVLPNHPVMVSELVAFQGSQLPSGKIKYSAPEGSHDDCLLPGTLIKTRTGYVPIEEIKPFDHVYTHKGRFRQVETCIAKPFDGDMYRMKFRGQLELNLSYNHPLYTACPEYPAGGYHPHSKRDWILPGDWKKKYRCVSVIDSPSKVFRQVDHEEFFERHKLDGALGLTSVKVDEGLAALLGRFVADGHATTQGMYVMGLAFHEDDKSIEYFADYLSGIGVACRMEEMRSRCINLTFSSKLLWYMLSQTYTDDRLERRLPPWHRDLGKHLKTTFEEWLKGDGWRQTRSSIQFNRNFKPVTIGCTTSKILALEMRDLAAGFGYYPRVNIRKGQMRLGTLCKDQFWVTVNDHGVWPETSGSRKMSDSEYGSMAEYSEKYHYKGPVYNLQVEEDQSFVANGIVVHNCCMSLAVGWSLVANQKSYGALEYLKKERAAMQEKRAVAKIVTSAMVKPAVGDKTLKCPECGSVAVSIVCGAEKRCNSCGIQFGGNPMQMHPSLRPGSRDNMRKAS